MAFDIGIWVFRCFVWVGSFVVLGVCFDLVALIVVLFCFVLAFDFDCFVFVYVWFVGFVLFYYARVELVDLLGLA